MPSGALEAAAAAAFTLDESNEKLTRIGMIEPRLWDSLPEGCGVHVHYRELAQAAVAAYLDALLRELPEDDE